MRLRRGRKFSSSSLSHSSPFTPRPPQWSLNSTWVSRCGKTSSRSTGISRVPQNGGTGTGLSDATSDRAGMASGSVTARDTIFSPAEEDTLPRWQPPEAVEFDSDSVAAIAEVLGGSQRPAGLLK